LYHFNLKSLHCNNYHVSRIVYNSGPLSTMLSVVLNTPQFMALTVLTVGPAYAWHCWRPKRVYFSMHIRQ